MICKGFPHARCPGSAGGCPMCLERLAVALERQEYWLWLCDELGWELALDKRQNPSQVFTYSGLIFDLIQGLLLVPGPKKDKIIVDLQGMLDSTMATQRRLMQVSGRLRHYSIGIMHTRVHCAHFTTVDKLHPDRDKDPDYDVPRFPVPCMTPAPTCCASSNSITLLVRSCGLMCLAFCTKHFCKSGTLASWS